MKKHYIYLIINKLNGHMYVGQTINIKKRWSEHSRPSRNKTAIERAFNKYGKDNFILKILQVIDNSIEANDREIYWIDYFDTYENILHYNMHIGGNAQCGKNNPMYGLRGENSPISKLTKVQGLEIYNEYKNNIKETIYTLSKKYKSNTSTILDICLGNHWTTFGLMSVIRKNNGFNRDNCLKQNQCIQIYNLYKNGVNNIGYLSSIYQVNGSTIREICRGTHWSVLGMSNLIPETHTSSKINREIGLEILNYYTQNANIKLKEVFDNFKKIYNISYRTVQRICLKQHWSVRSRDL